MMGGENTQGAFQLRGKTIEEMREMAAEQARIEALPFCKITLSKKEAKELEAATEEVEYLLHNAAKIFELLHKAFVSGGTDPNDAGVTALLEMVGRGLKDAAENEGVKCTQLKDKIRSEKELIHEPE